MAAYTKGEMMGNDDVDGRWQMAEGGWRRPEQWLQLIGLNMP